MLRDNLVELIEPMLNSAGANPLALTHHQIQASGDRLPCLENPRPKGAESSLTENVTSPFQAEPAHIHLETRPIHVRTEAHTRAHVLVVMLAYLIRRVLSRAWVALDVTVEEGLQQLKALSSTEMKSKDGGSCLRIPAPNPACRDLLQALDIRLPGVQQITAGRIRRGDAQATATVF